MTRDIYIAPGDSEFRQVALRDPDNEQFATLTEHAKDQQPFIVDVLYGDAGAVSPS